jgi:hypothetical protein
LESRYNAQYGSFHGSYTSSQPLIMLDRQQRNTLPKPSPCLWNCPCKSSFRKHHRSSVSNMLRLPLPITHGRVKCHVALSLQRSDARSTATSRSRIPRTVKDSLDSHTQGTAEEAAWPPLGLGIVGDGKLERAQRLIWLAKHSLATSTPKISNAANGTSNRARHEQHDQIASGFNLWHTQNWAVPTVWAHLW